MRHCCYALAVKMEDSIDLQRAFQYLRRGCFGNKRESQALRQEPHLQAQGSSTSIVRTWRGDSRVSLLYWCAPYASTLVVIALTSDIDSNISNCKDSNLPFPQLNHLDGSATSPQRCLNCSITLSSQQPNGYTRRPLLTRSHLPYNRRLPSRKLYYPPPPKVRLCQGVSRRLTSPNDCRRHHRSPMERSI